MKNFLTTAAVLASLAATPVLTSCGGDDDNTPGGVATAEAAGKVAGTYTCDGSLNVMNQTTAITAAAYKFEKEAGATVKMTIPSMEGQTSAMKFPDLPVSGVSAIDNGDGTYTLSLPETSYTVNADGADKTYVVSGLAGTVNADGGLTLGYSLRYGTMPMAMVVTVAGTKNK